MGAHLRGGAAGRLEIRNQVAGGDVVMNERIDHVTIEGRR
jgi:hypothetical protein